MVSYAIHLTNYPTTGYLMSILSCELLYSEDNQQTNTMKRSYFKTEV
jgi:hypothetical protein